MGLTVLGIGAVSSLGTYPGSCAAALAGLSGIDGAADFECFFQGDEEPGAVAVCAAPVISHGFLGVGRLVALLNYAVTNSSIGGHRLLELSQLPWYLALPDPVDRAISVTELDDIELQQDRVERFGRIIWDRHCELSGVSIPDTPLRFFGADRAAFLAALDAAAADLRSGSASECVVGAVDSLVTLPHLEELADDNLLKSPENGYGLVPGEAAVVFHLSRDSSKSSNGTVSVEQINVATKDITEDVRGDGRKLAETIAAAVAGTVGAGSPLAVFSDINGAREQSLEWGDALVHLAESGLADRISTTFEQATSFGDVGVAAPAVGLMIAAHGHKRRRLAAPNSLVLAAADSARCGAILVAGGQ